MKNHKKHIVSKIDTVTLEILYSIKLYRINEIAQITGKTRQRIWQLLKEYGLHNQSRVVRTCGYCDKRFEVVRSRARNGADKYCQEQCYYDDKALSGYQPDRQGRRRGRKIIEKWLGHPLPEGFLVHHEDNNEVNNELSNLIVFPSQSAHMIYHHAKRKGNAVKPYNHFHELPEMIDQWIKS